MLPEIIASAILILSAAGLGYFASKKIPVLLTYPAKEEGNSPKDILKDILRRFAAKAQALRSSRRVSSDILLQNVLSKTRIAAMKTESKTGQMLEKLRKRSKEKAPKFSEDYWKKLRRRG